jgi:tetratricopeptide (TPR) repeat protein
MTRTLKDVTAAIALTKEHDYLHARTRFVEIYGSETAPPIKSGKDAAGLSYFALCLALVQKKYKPAIELAKRAIDLEFYSGEHYANLSRIYLAAGNRKKAVETAEAGLKIAPEDEELTEVRKELGVRARPSVPFLHRSNPVNVSLGQARHAKKRGSGEHTKKPTRRHER